MLSNSTLVVQCQHPTFRDIETTHTVTVQDKSVHSSDMRYNMGQSGYAKKNVLLLAFNQFSQYLQNTTFCCSNEMSVLTSERNSIRDSPRAT